jgi:hypothetical protein
MRNEGTMEITFPVRQNLHHDIMGCRDILFLFIPVHEMSYSLLSSTSFQNHHDTTVFI